MSLTLQHQPELQMPLIAPQQPLLQDKIEAACARVPPLWPLQNFVAVNPFVGLSNHHFLDAAALVRRVTHGEMMMPLAYYREQWSAGRIDETDLQLALEMARKTSSANQNVSLQNVKDALQTASSTNDGAPDDAIFTVVDWLDGRGAQWRAFIIDEISKWCSAYFDEGQASWRMPWRGEPLFEAWKQVAMRDANPEMMGLNGFRAFVKSLPDNPRACIEMALQTLQIPSDGAADFLHRQLMSISGWSGYVAYQVREKGLYGQSDDSLQALLAIRLAYDLALFEALPSSTKAEWTQSALIVSPPNDASQFVNYVAQLGAECAYQRGLIANLKSATAPAKPTRPDVQAVFCIDVRSERFRRSFEATSPAVETIGFAGFFGFPIEVIPFGAQNGTSQCPVLLTPKFRIGQSLPGASIQTVEAALQEQWFSKRLGRGWNSFKTSAVSCFSFVETGGLLSGVKIVKGALNLGAHESSSALAPCVHRDDSHSHDAAPLGLSLDEQIAVASGALKHMGLTQFARIVLICGHGSSTNNNPYGSGLDCGACGGHTGEANARVAATVLNNPQTRAGLRDLGVEIPDDTHFLAALHNTTTDDVSLFDEHLVPATHADELAQLKRNLATASHQTRAERAESLGLAGVGETEIDEQVRARSLDWAQTRPEWGLAGNAAFIAAPRARTQSLNLNGRSFLNNYDHKTDADSAKLELVMTAPMVVASWINLQYFASTTNNRHFGSGNKTIHNVVGTVGVWQGNSGDLQVGLPLQSVHDGDKWMHEPLRLSVFIEAPRDSISAIIAKHPSVRELLDNGWLHLIAIEEEGQFARYCGGGNWEDVSV